MSLCWATTNVPSGIENISRQLATGRTKVRLFQVEVVDQNIPPFGIAFLVSHMLCSLILPVVLLASQTMALNSTYAYIPGFFAQDNTSADPNVIGAVRRTCLPECFRD